MALVYLSATKGEHFATARQDLVTMLLDFREQMEADNVRPNITTVVDNHLEQGVPTPYLSVGITGVGDMEYYGRSGSLYELFMPIEMEIWLHVSQMDGQFDERIKWYLLNSLMNYMKDRATISSNFDGMFLRRISGELSFTATGTQGSVMQLTVQKVAST